MISVCFLVLIAVIYVLTVFEKKKGELKGSFFLIIMAICCIIGFITIIFCIFDISKESDVNNQLEKYQNENAKIQSEMDKVVETYMEYKKDELGDLKIEGNNIYFVNMFPELKSDELIQKQIQIYMDNSQSIKDLEVRKNEISESKWLLYFGN